MFIENFIHFFNVQYSTKISGRSGKRCCLFITGLLGTVEKIEYISNSAEFLLQEMNNLNF